MESKASTSTTLRITPHMASSVRSLIGYCHGGKAFYDIGSDASWSRGCQTKPRAPSIGARWLIKTRAVSRAI